MPQLLVQGPGKLTEVLLSLGIWSMLGGSEWSEQIIERCTVVVSYGRVKKLESCMYWEIFKPLIRNCSKDAE